MKRYAIVTALAFLLLAPDRVRAVPQSGPPPAARPHGAPRNADGLQCAVIRGHLVADVRQHDANLIDIGDVGPWNYEFINHRVQIWQTGADTFCVVFRNAGFFNTVAGPSPGGTGQISAGIAGPLVGSSTIAVHGALNPHPPYPTHGDAGTFNALCDAPSGTCTGVFFDWPTFYFTPGSTINVEQFEFIYFGGEHGTWVNALTGNRGDITD